jgi:1-acyl-sn-glycerol-3-phosphate acyltransferase
MIRGILFHGLLVVWTLLLGVISLPLYGFPRALPWVQRFWSWGGLAFLRLVGLQHQVQDPSGVLRKRPSPILFVSRHHSAWETMAYITLLTSKPTLRFVLKKELLSLPFFGWYLRRVGMIALNRRRGGEALRLLKTHVKKAIQNGHDIVIYPEGTRTDVGSPLILQRGVLVAYEAAGVPVIPITLDSGRFWPKNSLKKYPGTVTIRIHDIIPAGLPREVFWERINLVLRQDLD